MNVSEIKRVLFVRMSALGDILHALPAQREFAARLPSARIDWLAEKHYGPLLEQIPGIARVWSVDTRAWRRNPLMSGEVIQLVRDLRRQRYDVAVDFQGLLKSASLAWLSGARLTLGFRPERFKERGIDWFYDVAAPGEADLGRHVIDTNLDLVRRLIPRCEGGAELPIRLPDEDMRFVEDELNRLQAPKPAVISPGAGWATKLWPIREYAELGILIEKKLGIPVVYAYGPGEESHLEEVREHWKPRLVRAFPTTILQLAALCLRSAVVIGGDSGPLHLAVAMGAPTVAVMGPTAPRRNGPYNREDEVVRRQLHCSNSYRRTCDEFICMDIPVETVFQAVVRRLTRIDELVPLEAGCD